MLWAQRGEWVCTLILCSVIGFEVAAAWYFLMPFRSEPARNWSKVIKENHFTLQPGFKYHHVQGEIKRKCNWCYLIGPAKPHL